MPLNLTRMAAAVCSYSPFDRRRGGLPPPFDRMAAAVGSSMTECGGGMPLPLTEWRRIRPRLRPNGQSGRNGQSNQTHPFNYNNNSNQTNLFNYNGTTNKTQ